MTITLVHIYTWHVMYINLTWKLPTLPTLRWRRWQLCYYSAIRDPMSNDPRIKLETNTSFQGATLSRSDMKNKPIGNFYTKIPTCAYCFKGVELQWERSVMKLNTISTFTSRGYSQLTKYETWCFMQLIMFIYEVSRHS